MSSEGAAQSPLGGPRELPRSFLRAQLKLGEAQKSFPEALKSLEVDIKIQNLDFHETIEKTIEKHWFVKLRKPVVSSDLLRIDSQAKTKGARGNKKQTEREEK